MAMLLASTIPVFAAGPAAAQVTELDCEVTAAVTNLSEGRVSETTDRGVWRIAVSLEPGFEADITVRNSDTYFIDGERNRLNSWGRDLQTTPDAYTFCLYFGGCGATVRSVRDDGWFKISRSRLDRRRGIFTTTVETFSGLTGLHERVLYSGQCAPPLDQRF